ncbi:MAG TPA: hypothetical protein VK841_07230 [Polyangiaceae bacterium]|nr:hypothetical protein [Polyangiaceae bacterium]
MDSFEPRAWCGWLPAVILSGGCFGLGNYEVDSCPLPLGTSSIVQATGNLAATSDLTFVSMNGASRVAAFADVSSVLAVSDDGFVGPSAGFFGALSLSPRQPSVVPIGSGFAALAIATTSPCTSGQIAFEYVSADSTTGDTVVPSAEPCPTAGSALPSLVPLPDGATAIAAWYQTSIASRSDPLESCAAAVAAPLVAAVVAGATTDVPALGQPVVLTTSGISLRQAALTPWPGHSQVLLAAPDQNSVSLWALDATLASVAPSIPVAALAGARAVSLAIATDGSDRVAIVAEIGCSPQSIALAVGTPSGNFGPATIVAAQGDAPAVQPSVAWVPAQGNWIVSWISATGGPHVLARRFALDGSAAGGAIDPATPATGACVGVGGDVLAYAPQQPGGSFLNVSLGCVR